MTLAAALAVAGCSNASSNGEAVPTSVYRGAFTQLGDNLSLTVYQVDVRDQFYYKLPSKDETYVVTPSDPGHKITAVYAQVRNHGSSKVLLDVNTSALSIRDAADVDYKVLDPTVVGKLAPNVPRKQEVLPVMWGPADMPQGYGIIAWSFYEIPNNVIPTKVRWDQVDIIFVPYTTPVSK